MLRWTAVSGGEYRIYENPPGRSIYVTGTTYTPKPQPGGKVSYKVAAAHKQSPWSNTVTIGYRARTSPLAQKEEPRPTPPPSTPVPATPSTPLPVGVPGNWTLKFDDEFNASSLDGSKWVPGEFWGGASATGEGIGAEINFVCTDSANVSEPGDGYLHLKLTPQSNTCNSTQHGGTETTLSTGGLVETNPFEQVTGHVGYRYAYGYVEWRAYLQGSAGQIANWPGLWSLGCCNWPHEGENDTFEASNWSEGRACWHFHSDAGAPGECAPGDYTGWHTFGSDWQPGVVTYYYDGVRVGQITTGITSSPQVLAMNIGARSPREAVSGEMLVDYVRVWQEPPPKLTPVLNAAFTARTRCP